MNHLIGEFWSSSRRNVWPSTAFISAQQQLNRDSGQAFLRQALLGLTPDETASALIPT
jgi:DNA-directed RNA polymerase specialized sigma24 family protein